jgi:hypothetical protein
MDGIIGGSARDHLEDGITAEKFAVVLIFIISDDAVDTLSNHGDEAMFGEFGVALISQGNGDLLGESDEFVELTNGNESAIRGEGCV